MKYRFLEHTADVLFEAYGKELEDLFANAALATEEIMIDLKTLQTVEKKEIKIEAENVEDLLFNFLEELLFLKDTELFLCKEFELKIKKEKKYVLEGILVG